MSDIIAQLHHLDASSFKNEGERKQAISEAHALISRIETTWDTASRLVLTIPAQMATLKAAHDLGLYSKWLEKNGGAPASITELEDLVECDSELFLRIIRHLAATNMLWLRDDGLYEMTLFAKGMVTEDMASVVDFFFQLTMPLSLETPSFLQDIQYRTPTGKDNDDCCQHWSNQKLWSYLATNPAVALTLNRYMKASSIGRGNFAESYPVDDLSGDVDDVLVVDIGGGIGHDLIAFKTGCPRATGRLILQDQPEVIETAKENGLPDFIQAMAYDFFTPQPVQGARIYLLHAILHDWPDADVNRILDNVRPALKKGYSKLLIHEVVIPTERPDMESTSRDWTMLSLVSGKERTAKQWSDLLSPAGFVINRVWRSPRYVEAVIETELA